MISRFFTHLIWVKHKTLSTVTFICALVFLSQPYAAASELSLLGWDITGFGTIGYAETGKYDDLVLKRNITQDSQKIEDKGWLIDSRLGVQARKELDPHWDAVVQLVAQEKIDNSLENALDMAFLRYRSDANWSFRLGRMALDTFQLSDYRNVGYSYHWVRPPTEFYGWIPLSNYDGVKAIYEIGDFDSLLRFEAFIGKSKSTVNIGYKNDDTSMNYVKAAPGFGGGVTWEKNDLTLRAYISRYRFTQNTNALNALLDYVSNPLIQTAWPEAIEIAHAYEIENAKLTYGAIGFSWTPGPWIYQGEVSHINASNFGTYDGERAYFHVGRRFGEFLPHITFSRAWDTRDFPYERPPLLPMPPATLQDNMALQGLYNTLSDNIHSGTMNQYTWSLGIRWDFASQKALKLQCDRTTLHDESLGVFPTQNTVDGYERQFDKDSRTWCSATFDWVF